MIQLSVSILIYQIISLVGLLALGRIIMAFASKTNDIDIKLMYSQRFPSIFRSSKKFKMTRVKIIFVYGMTLVSIAMTFLPTLLLLSADYKPLADNSHIKSFDGSEQYINLWSPLQNLGISPSSTTKFFRNKFIENYGTDSTPSFASFLESYIRSLGLQTEQNPTGIWFKAAEYNLPDSPVLKKEHVRNRATILPQQVDSLSIFTNYAGKTTYSFGRTPGDNSELASSSLKYCVENNNLSNLTDIEGHNVRAVNKFSTTCLPVYDASLTIHTVNTIILYPRVFLMKPI